MFDLIGHQINTPSHSKIFCEQQIGRGDDKAHHQSKRLVGRVFLPEQWGIEIMWKQLSDESESLCSDK